jgi:hypothetical protein
MALACEIWASQFPAAAQARMGRNGSRAAGGGAGGPSVWGVSGRQAASHVLPLDI